MEFTLLSSSLKSTKRNSIFKRKPPTRKKKTNTNSTYILDSLMHIRFVICCVIICAIVFTFDMWISISSLDDTKRILMLANWCHHYDSKRHERQKSKRVQTNRSVTDVFHYCDDSKLDKKLNVPMQRARDRVCERDREEKWNEIHSN